MKKNVLIVNFNTQKLTEACIKSINKCVSGCTIYVFDNSDKTPFINNFENVIVIDNTKEEIANFTEIKERHKGFANKGALDNDYGSMKHCLSIEKAMNIIEDGFILLDSDVLIKKDFSNLYDNTVVFVGKKEKMKSFKMRVEPFMVYINVKMCKEHNIHFFNEEHMFGFYDAKGGENYDTGCWFYEACENLPKKEIATSQYMIHFRGASWFKKGDEKKKITPEKWLEKNKHYWYEEMKPVVTPDVSETATTEPEEEKVQPKATIKPKNKAVSFRSLEALRKSGGNPRKIYLRKA